MWQQVDALRELMQHGSRLLGEVVVFARAAEEAVGKLAAEKEALAQQQESLEVERCRASQAAEKALARMEVQQRELSSMREEMERLRQLAASQASAPANGEQLATLERRLHATEQELARTRLHLDQERERRNRAISLIRPNVGVPRKALEEASQPL